MARNLQVEPALNVGRSVVKDEDGNDSPLMLNPDRVGIGTSLDEKFFEQDENTVLFLQRRAPGHLQGVSFKLNPTEKVFHLDVGGGQNAAARIHLGDASNPDNPVTTLGNVGIGTTNPTEKLDVVSGKDSAVRIKTTGTAHGGAVVKFQKSVTGAEREWWAGVGVYRASDAGFSIWDNTELANRLYIDTSGNVAIGDITPNEKLVVNGNILATGDVQLTGADCAEEFDVVEDVAVEPGTVMVVEEEDTLRPCDSAYDKRVAGVISGAGDYRPGIVLDRQPSSNKRTAIAISGKVYCKVDAQHGAIEVGDLLTTSPNPGYAMKADDPMRAFGAVIGKALKTLRSGTGLVPILVALQ